MNWEDHVVIDKRLFRPLDIPSLKGDYHKAEQAIGWKPKTSFSRLVEIMVDADLKRWNDALQGKVFPWDIPGSTNFGSVIKSQAKR